MPRYLPSLYFILALSLVITRSFILVNEQVNEAQDQIINPIVSNDLPKNDQRSRFLQNQLQFSFTDNQPKPKGIGLGNNLYSLNSPTSTNNYNNVPDTSTNTKVVNTQFNNIILYHYIPLILSNQEYFQIRGRILSPPQNKPDSFIGFAFFSTQGYGRYDYVKHLEVGTTEFSILLNLKKIPPGQYQIGANVAWEWSNSPTKRTISNASSLLSLQAAPKSPTNFKIDLKDNKLFFKWDEDNKTQIYKLSFTQGNLTKEYVFGNFVSSFEAPYKDFYNFKNSSVTVKLSSATSKTSSLTSRKSQYSSPVSLTFTPTNHRWSLIDKQQIQYDIQIPQKINVGDKIQLKGTANNDLKKKIVVEQPSKSFLNYYFDETPEEQIFKSNNAFDLEIPFNAAGVYAVQILNKQGQTVLNKPIYVGNVFPLFPNYVDLQPDQIDPKSVSNAQPSSLDKQRAKLLQLINDKRSQYGSTPVTEDIKLDTLAQNHSSDMVRNQYFDDVNQNGQGPQERATKLGITQLVGQIIVMNLNLTQAHLQISRSPSRLQLLVDPTWANVGLGLSRTIDKVFKITEVFAGSSQFAPEITDQVISSLKSKIVVYIISNYISIVKENVKLTSAIKQWLNMSIEQQEAATFSNFLQHKGFNDYIKKEQIFTYSQNFFQNNLQGSQFLNPLNNMVRQFGVGIRKVSETELQIYVVFV